MTRSTSPAVLAVLLVALAGCATPARLPVEQGMGPDPALPPPSRSTFPTVNIAPRVGWPDGATPTPADGWAVNAFADGLDHPRWLYPLPNGDLLVAETNRPPRPDPPFSLRRWFQNLFMKKAGAAVPSANRITLLRDADGDGRAETRSALLTNLFHPFGMALVGGHLYVANADAVVRFPYRDGDTRITASAEHVADLPGGPINHHWTKSLVANADGTKLYVGVGSNSNIGEQGLDNEVDRAAVLEIDLATGDTRVFASGLRNPVGLDWEPESGALWVAVNERDELGSDLVPDYMTAIADGEFFGWPWSYYGDVVDERVQPQRPDMVARARKPDYALGPHTASLGLAFGYGGAFIGQHGSWNREPKSGYKVIFVPFEDGMPSGPSEDVLTGFLNASDEAQGRPVGVAIARDGALLVADDVGNVVWRARRVPRAADVAVVRDTLAATVSPELARAESEDTILRILEAYQRLEAARQTIDRWTRPWNRTCASEICNRVEVTGSRIKRSDVITNNQEAGVDEGDIVKKHGQFLIVLRRGKLYSIATGSDDQPTLMVADSISALPDDIDDARIWFDEILTHDRGVILLAYNYGLGHSELITFSLDEHGRFSRSHRLWLESDDYYDVGNYGARIVADTLVMTLAQGLDTEIRWPAWSHAESDDWRPLAGAQDIFLPTVIMNRPTAHVAFRCSLDALARGQLDCASFGLLGDANSELYVSTRAMYLAQTAWDADAYLAPVSLLRDSAFTAIYRIPFGPSESPGVVRVDGVLSDQFSFKDAGGALYLATETRHEGRKSILLSHLPIDGFTGQLQPAGGVVAELPLSERFPLLRLADDELWIAEGKQVYIQPFSGAPGAQFELEYEIDRIEPVGPGAVFLSGASAPRSSHATVGVRDGDRWRLAPGTDIPGHLVQPGWSHEFNAARRTDDEWIVGIGAYKLDGPSSKKGMTSNERRVTDLAFMEIIGGRLSWLGGIEMDRFVATDEQCDGGCIEWYGDVRAFFIGTRIFALSDNAMVEAIRRGGTIEVLRSVAF